MTKSKSPTRWAADLTVLLKTCSAESRFPVDVKSLAFEYTNQVFPNDPIKHVEGRDLPGFEGALIKLPGKDEWGILYNSSISSSGRINFTLAHEFGHYLVHRHVYPDGFYCKPDDMVSWNSPYLQVEQEANEFAANLLMPLDDYRQQLGERDKPSLDDIGFCASRYGVSLIAATLRWLQYTQRRAVLVKSTDGFINWARSSTPALRTGVYFKTFERDPIEIPEESLPKRPGLIDGKKGTVEHGQGVWHAEPCTEHALLSEKYEFDLSLLIFDDACPRFELSEDAEEDTFDRMVSRTPGSSWLG